MNLVDGAIVVLCAGFALFGIVKGLVRQISNWTGLVLGHILGVRYHGEAERFLRLGFHHGDIVAYLVVFVTSYIAVRLLGLLAERWVRSSKLSGTDRAAGMVAGFVNGALLSILLVFSLVILLPRDAAVLREARLAPTAIAGARWLERVFPERIGRAFREKVRPPGEGPGGKGGAEARPGGGKDGGTGSAPPPAPQPKNRSRK